MRCLLTLACLVLTTYALPVAPSPVLLTKFDGSSLQRTWTELNDPVMGGKSTGTAFVNGSGFLMFEGEVLDVPSLKAPGFIAVQSDTSPGFPDASGAIGGDLILEIRSSTPEYTGWKVTFNSGSASPKYSCAGGGSIPFSRGCFKAAFNVTAGADFSEVRVPFTAFTDLWSAASGLPTKTCDQDKSTCVTASKLAKIQMLEFMAEGALGKVHLEVKSISAGTNAR